MNEAFNSWSRLDVLRTLAKLVTGTASDIGRTLGSHPRTISSQIANLSAIGAIVRARVTKAVGFRRTATLWAVTDQGRGFIADPRRLYRQPKSGGKADTVGEAQAALKAFRERERARLHRAKCSPAFIDRYLAELGQPPAEPDAEEKAA